MNSRDVAVNGSKSLKCSCEIFLWKKHTSLLPLTLHHFTLLTNPPLSPLHLFTSSPLHLFTSSPLHSFTPSLAHPFIHSPLHSFTLHPFTPSPIYPFTNSPLHHFNPSPLGHFTTLPQHHTNTNTNTNNLFLTAQYMIHKVQCIKIHYWVLVIRMRFVGGNYEFSGGWGCK